MYSKNVFISLLPCHEYQMESFQQAWRCTDRQCTLGTAGCIVIFSELPVAGEEYCSGC